MPSHIYIKGKLPDERIPAVAIIGSRKPTPYGEEVTYKLAYELAKRGVVIISGLAFGVDAVAHRATLDAGGVTIAVMAQGLHRIYPVAHKTLAEQIIRQGGAIISEREAGVEAHRYDFLARNRIVSGLADAVIVTEATERSGTSSTVSHAIDQNKDVFAVPGPITSLLSAGPHRILQQGAHLVINATDILNVIAPQSVSKKNQATLRLAQNATETQILKHIEQGTSDLDQLLTSIDLPASEILQAVTMLELNGIVRTVAGKLHFV